MDNTTIPAQAGYYILTAVYADDGTPREFNRTPVVAWHVVHGTAYPVGDAYDYPDAILRPNGSVYIPGERFEDSRRFKNEADALQHFAKNT